MVGGGRYDNLLDSNSLSLSNFPTQDYIPIYEVVQLVLKFLHLQDILPIILNQTVGLPK